MSVLQHLRVQRSSDDVKSWAALKRVWVPDETEGYVAAEIRSDSGDSITCERVSDHQTVTIPKDDTQQMNPPKFNKVEDMAELTHLNEASVLHNLRDRYMADLIYTYSGLFCVVINPYKQLPIYTEEAVALYKGKKRENMPPHVFAIADTAYRSMLQDRDDQSILCTGESGAGKTENTKKVIQYLASVAAAGRAKDVLGGTSASGGMGKGELERQLLQANPILETFGNAATIKNDNSSRFGKFIKIHFDAAGVIIGATIDTYLLEKSRAIRQNEGERNFHAFYQLLRGADTALITDFGLQDIKSYRFMSNGDVTLRDIDDKKEFKQTNEAFGIMGMSSDEINDVWRVISAVLLFGNVNVLGGRRGDDQASITSDVCSQRLCSLLGINHNDFIKSMTRPRVKAGKDFVQKAQTKEQVEFALEALAKALYERLFLWVVQRINMTLDKNVRDSRNFIGILDIAGFEIFKNNSFEQLCINYTNEKLQQLFNHRMFKLEQEEYSKEEIDWEFIDFGLDLQPTIELIDGQMGVLKLVDEECFFPKATDKSLAEKVVHNCKSHEKLVPPGVRDDFDFAIVHYAGTVQYSAEGWLVKNKDPLNDNATAQLEDSSIPFIKSLWSDDFSTSVASGSRTRKGAFRTVGFIYKDQLSRLMDTLHHTVPNFVRCIIPNHKKRPGMIDAQLVLDQLACNGVLEGIRICRKGFPNRILFQEFRQRYSILTPDAVGPGFTEGRTACERMLEALNLDPNSYRVGLTKVFFRAGVLAHLEEERDIRLSKMIVGLQAHCRGYLARRHHGALLHGSNAILVIQSNVRAYMKLRSWAWWKLFTRLKPLLKHARSDDEMRELREKVDQLQEQLQAERQAREAAENEADKMRRKANALEDDIQVCASTRNLVLFMRNLWCLFHGIDHRIEELTDSSARLNEQNNVLSEEIAHLEEQLAQEMDSLQTYLIEKKDLLAQLEDMRGGLDVASVNEARATRLEEQLSEARTKSEETQQEMAVITEEKAKLNKEISGLREELDQALNQKARAVKAQKKVESEVEDLHVEIQTLQATISSLNNKQRSHDKFLAEERDKTSVITEERDSLQSQIRELSTKVLTLKNELETVTDRLETAESAKRRLQAEIDDMIANQDDSAKTELENAKRVLTQQVEEMKQQVLELEDDNQILNEQNLRMKVDMQALEQKANAVDVERAEEDAKERKKLQRKLHELEEELESERRTRSKLAGERKRLELEVSEAQQLAEEERLRRDKDNSSVRKYEKRIQMLMQERDEAVHLAELDTAAAKKMQSQIESLKLMVDEAEERAFRAESKMRRAERDRDELSESLSALESKMGHLQTHAKNARLRREELTIEYSVRDHRSGSSAASIRGGNDDEEEV
ncbi:uncharacterized protein MONBRDRAFT_13965 [Monosiga brevicollis MX1]|uniref:Uncharacterized protein n=1 Tax=Monosiga brevicollis TaxID=81824 RepID=A9UP63_MONBE|nr:uncharacterized protein MONBRDRAFT_13965 [Monosiga brevicollis MX1]EDQ92819.1 predicted protein [Monosiga brevicollis MX1]|eukprot:XP_001742581.1 hypothetical protein [Monosiga brevicollis MX1]